MGVMTVGAGSVLLGGPVLGTTTAVTISWVLWSIGTALGLITTAWIPYRMITQHSRRTDSASTSPVAPLAPSGGWLMPVVRPMVSAADGALLLPHMAAGTGKTTMFSACYAMFGISLFATLAILPRIWNKLVVHDTGPAATVPTMWIVLGQSVTAANLLAKGTTGALPELYATGTQVFALMALTEPPRSC